MDNEKKLQILEMVAKGCTMKEAGESVGISGSRARQILATKCRELGVRFDVDYIRTNHKRILSIINETNKIQASKLSKKLQHILLSATGLTNLKDLTPELVSKIKGPRLLKVPGLGPGTVIEIQSWLQQYGLSLSIEKPATAEDERNIAFAIAMLKIYGFDVKCEAKWAKWSEMGERNGGGRNGVGPSYLSDISA